MEWLPELHSDDHTYSTNGYLPSSLKSVTDHSEDTEEKFGSESIGVDDDDDGTDTVRNDSTDMSDNSVEFAAYEGIDLSAKYWGPTRDITEDALASLAKRAVATHRDEVGIGSCTLLSRQHGVYNSVYILQFQDGERVCVRVPACGWSERWNQYDKELLRSTALAMRMLEEKTTVPLPRVMDYDCSSRNEIGAPFMLLSCIGGTGARQVWNADDGRVSKEVRRQNILRGIAQAMAGLRQLRFSKSGSLWFHEDSGDEPVVGKSWNLRIEGYIIKREFEIADSYRCTRRKVLKDSQRFLDTEGFPDNCPDFSTKGMCEIYRLITDAFLIAAEVADSAEEFVLMHGDFDIQNMMVDDEGNLMGILDWDGLSSQPCQTGWSMVPFWLQNDWSPGYQWPPAIGANYAMVRPDEFERYRQDYARYLWEACDGIGDCRFTTKSHIYRAFLGSTSGPFEARKFVENVLADILPRSRGEAYCTQLGEYGFRSGEKEWLEKRLYAFFKPEPPVSTAPDGQRSRSLTGFFSGFAPMGQSWSINGVLAIENILRTMLNFLRNVLEMLSGGLLPISESHVRGGRERR